MVRSKVVHVTVIDEVVAQLEDAIVGGEYPPNSRLPSEGELSRQLEVSRPILREALARLRERGYLRTINGRGTYVRNTDLDTASEALLRQVRLHVGTQISVDDLYEVRRTIEVSSVRLAALRATPEQLDSLVNLVDRMDSASTGDPQAYSAADAGFHLTIAEASANPLYPLLLAPVIDLILKGIYQSVESSRGRMRSGVRDHRRIVHLLRAGDPDAAEAEVIEHLGRSRSMHTASTVETRTSDDHGWPRAIRMY